MGALPDWQRIGRIPVRSWQLGHQNNDHGRDCSVVTGDLKRVLAIWKFILGRQLNKSYHVHSQQAYTRTKSTITQLTFTCSKSTI